MLSRHWASHALSRRCSSARFDNQTIQCRGCRVLCSNATVKRALPSAVGGNNTETPLRTPAPADTDICNNGSGIGGGRGRRGGGGNGGGSGGSGQGRRDDDSSPSLEWYTRAVMTMLGAVGLYVMLGRSTVPRSKALQDREHRTSGLQPGAGSLQPESLREDIQALKRLQRETFEGFVDVNQRLDKLEPSTSGSGRPSGNGSKCKAYVETCQALQLAHTSDGEQGQHSAETAAQCGVLRFLKLRIRAESWLRDRQLGLAVECGTGDGLKTRDSSKSQLIALQKVLATWKARDGVKLVFPLLGATGEDAVVTLNPQAGRGVTHLLRHGSGLHRLCQGAGMGAVFTRGALGLSMAHLTQGDMQRGLRGSTLMQVAGAINEDIMVGAHALRVDKLSLPATLTGLLPTSIAGPDANGGSLQLHQQEAEGAVVVEPRGQRYGFAGAWNLGSQMTLSGWCSFGRSFTANSQHSDWGVTLGTFPQPSSGSWALSLGRCAPFELGAWKTSPLVAEGMLRFCVDDKLVLMPSLICLKADGGVPSLAIALRSEWEL